MSIYILIGVGLIAEEVAYELIGSAGNHPAVLAHERKRATTRNKCPLKEKLFWRSCSVCPAHHCPTLPQGEGTKKHFGDFLHRLGLIRVDRMRYGRSFWGLVADRPVSQCSTVLEQLLFGSAGWFSISTRTILS